MTQDNIIKLHSVINTLNKVTVSGEENLDRLLGSIQTLHSIADDLKAASKAASKEGATDGGQVDR